MAKSSSMTGVGGWLALLVFWLLMLGPLTTVGNTYRGFADAAEHLPDLAGNPQWPVFRQITWIVVACSSALSIAAGYRLLMDHTPSSVSLAKWFLWIVGPTASALHVFIVPSVVLDAPIGDADFARFIGALVASFIAATIWTLYLSRSVRVQNTYRLRSSDSY